MAAIFSAMNEVILIFDKKGTYINIIPTNSTNFYIAPERLIGQNISEIFPPATSKIFLKNIKEVAKSRKTLTIEYDLQIEKEIKWFRATISAFNHNKVLWVARDISERKKIETENIASNAKYKLLMEESNDAIFIADAATGILLEANKKARSLIGKPLAEIKKMHHSRLHPKADRKKAIDDFKQKADKSSLVRDTKFLQHKNGKLIPVEITSTVININGKKYIQGIFRDISEELEYKEKLKHQISFFEQVYMQSSISTQILDKDGWCVRINPKLSELFGVLPGDIEGKKYNIFRDKVLINENIIPILRKVFDKGETAEWEISFDIGASADSQKVKILRRAKKWFHNKAYPVFDQNGKIRNVIIHHEDITEKKANEEKIKMLALSLENIKECVSITDLNNKLIYGNEAFLKTYGYRLDEIIGRDVFFLRPGYLPELPGRAANPKTIQESWQGELINIKKDGTRFPIYLSTAAVRDENKDIIALIGIATDITERLKQEKEILKLSRAVEQSPTSIEITSVDGIIEYVNPKFARVSGYTVNEVIGQKASILKSGETNREEYAELWKTIISGKEWRGEFHNKKKDGELFWESASISPIFNLDGTIINYLAIKEDITLRKESERLLKESETKYRSLFATSTDALFILDQKTGAILDINETAIKLYGYTKEEMLKLRNVDMSAQPGETEKALTSGLQRTSARFHKKKNGEIFPVDISASYFTQNDRKVSIASIRDITDIKRFEKELILAKEKAEEMNSMKTKFLANMSHELRTPLIGVLGYAEILRNDLDSNEQKEMAGTIYDSGKRLLHTLNLLLDLTRIEANQEELYFREVNIGHITRTAVKLFDIYAVNKNLILETKIINNVNANLDERIFVQILNNLVNNAIKYTDKGKITVEIDSKNDDLTLKVKDTGIGIPADKQNVIFDEFRQVSEGLNRRHQGTGLGLTITKKYIEMLNGSISVKSRLNVGSIFTVRIPLNNLK